jgi:hypothetical protein
MQQFLKNRLLGCASLAVSMVGAGTFYVAYLVAERSPSLVGSATAAGKAAIIIDLLAAAAGGIGILVDRHKLLALAALVLGFLLAGFFGMFVYNI